MRIIIIKTTIIITKSLSIKFKSEYSKLIATKESLKIKL